MKKILAFLLAALMIVPALCACGKKEQTLVRLNEVTHSVFYAPQYVAMSQGFFEAEGLKVELTNGGGADKVMTAVVSGQSDIGLAGPEASIYVYNQGKEDHTQIIAQLTKRDGSFLVGRSDGEFSWEDLRGKTVIGGRKGGVPEMTLEYVLRRNGLTPGVDVTVDTSVQFNMMAGAFTGGQGDYVTLFEPTATQVEAAGQGYVLTSIGLESGEIPYTAYFANMSWLEKNADTAQRFVNAIAKAQKWVQEHTDRQVAEAICDQFPDTDLAETVCLLTREKSVKSYAYVDITPSELGMGGKVKKPTYKQIQAYVLETHGLKVSPLYIANVKDEFGLEKQFSYEEAGMSAKKRPNCPSEKRAAIIDALIHFGMLDEDARETE